MDRHRLRPGGRLSPLRRSAGDHGLAPRAGARRRAIRLLYVIGAAFLLSVVLGDSLVQFVEKRNGLGQHSGRAGHF